MPKNQIMLTPQEILEKDFNIDTRGYRLQEVDKYLDVIISDYNEYGKLVSKLEAEVDALRLENGNLKDELRKTRHEKEVLHRTGEREVTNVDLLKRISDLEKYVYGMLKRN